MTCKKTTVTFEHYRTFEYGDFYMFVDLMKGEKFDGKKTEVYTEISPRLSLSKLTNNDLCLGIIKDFFIATQINAGYDYDAYLGGLGVDLELPGFLYFSLNAYYKDENVEKSATLQITPAYKTISWNHLHFEGFIDYTPRSINMQNQFLYNFSKAFFGGVEWLYYHYDAHGSKAQTNVWQAMLKYQF